MATKEEHIILGYDTRDPEQKQALIEHLVEQRRAGKQMKEALQVPDHQLEQIYTLAYSKYQNGDYAAARDFFQYLLFFDEHCYKYLLGYAACLHRLKEYGSAGRAYQLASLHCPKDPVPYFHAADCFIHTKETDAAIAGLEMTIRLCEKEERYAELGERAKLTLAKITGKKTPKKTRKGRRVKKS